MLQNPQCDLDLLRFDASKWSNHLQKPSCLRLVFDQPLPTCSTGTNLANTKFVAQPTHVRLTQLGCFDSHSNTESEPFGRMAFKEGHDGSRLHG